MICTERRMTMRYSIEGEPMPVVICELEPGEEMITESGGMAWMTPNMQMSQEGGGFGKMFGRMLTGESMFLTHYRCEGGPGTIAFASSFTGAIRPVEIGPGRELIALVVPDFNVCAENGVTYSVCSVFLAENIVNCTNSSHFCKTVAGSKKGIRTVSSEC